MSAQSKLRSHSSLTLQSLPEYHARYRAEYTALTFRDRQWSFFELNRLTNRLANALLGAGLQKGDRFATVLPNSLELMLAYWAAAVSGLVIVPCSTLLQKNGLQALLDDSGAKLIITSIDSIEGVESISPQLTELLPDGKICIDLLDSLHIEGWQSYSSFVAIGAESAPQMQVHPDDLYNIMYSSGTTGSPKGILHTHQIRSLYGTLFANAWRMTPESVVLHAGAIVFNGAMLDLMPWLFLGCQYILHEHFDPGSVIADVEKYGVTHLVMVPAQIISILKSPAYAPEKMSSIEMLHNVGAPLHLHYKQQINRDLPDRYYELYGVTEGFMTILDKTESTTKTGSVGKPAPFNRVAILDQNGNACAPKEIGEICGQGPLVMPGYHNRPVLTANAFHGDWLRSGDLGYLDRDGYVFLVDRVKDMIISGGVNVYPKDIEETVILHPAVVEVAVFGTEDEKWGEVPIAAVTIQSPVTAEEIVRWVNLHVDAKYQRLADCVIIEEFPRNVAGKILKRELRKNFDNRVKYALNSQDAK